MVASLSLHFADDCDQEAWDRFVAGHPRASMCHLFAWRTVFERAYGKRCYYLVAADEGRWGGVLPLVHMRGLFGSNRLISLPFLDQGGILAASPEAASVLWTAALDLAARTGAEGLDLRGGDLPADPQPGEDRRFRFVLPLPAAKESLWATVGSKVRNQVRKSEKEGLASARKRGEVGAFFEVFSRNMRDLGSPVHGRSFFESLLSALPEADIYLTADRQGDVVAAGIALRFGDSVTVPWASALRSARSACPNHSLYWSVLGEAVETGARCFDFGRSSVGSGTYQFKKQWGARAEPLRWGFYRASGEAERDYYLDPSRQSALASAWRHLPLGLANWLGPKVRRHLPN